jgi:hypothetical protein
MAKRPRHTTYKGKSVSGRRPSNGTKRWGEQRLALILHTRKQPEEEISLVDANKEHTYVHEWVMENNDLLTTEDGNFNFLIRV